MNKRPLVAFSIFLILGIFLSSKYSFYIPLACIILSLIFILIFKIHYSMYRIICFTCLFALLLGALLYTFTEKQVTNKFTEWNEQKVSLEGKIEEIDKGSDKVTLNISLRSIQNESGKQIKGGKVIIYVTGNVDNKGLLPGDIIYTEGMLTLPKGIRNPGGFDYRKYLTSKKVSATIFTNASDFIVISKGHPLSLIRSGYILRQKIINAINILIPEKQAALLNGMLIGYTDNLDEETSQEFRDAGLSHIMAVSGSNVAFIVFPLFFLLRKIGLSERMTSLLVIPVLILFIFITGFSASVARAVIMAIIVLIGKFLYRETDTLTLIALSIIILLLYNPFLVFDAGFQLSYGATLGIILFYNTIYQFFLRIKLPASIAGLIGVTIAAQIGVLPISVFHFNRISVISVISNLIVVPTTEGITISGFLMVIIGSFLGPLAKILAAANILMLTFILKITQISASIPLAAINMPTPRLLQIILFYCFVLYFLKIRGIKRLLDLKKEVIFSVMVGIAFILPFMLPKPFTIYFLDVGQGDSALIRTNTGKCILIDGGGYTSTKNKGKTMGSTVIIPFLYDIGVMKLDMVVLTHGHDDHMAGLEDVLKNVKVEKFLIPKTKMLGNELDGIIELAQKNKSEIYKIEAGDKIQIDKNSSFKAVFPNDGFGSLKPTLNNTSLVLQLSYKGTSVLFCGDMEEDAEKFLLQNGENLKSDIIKIGHHGSSTSSSKEFIEAVKPSLSIISVGKNNYGHPSPLVIERVKAIGRKMYRTDESGAIILTLKSGNVNIKRMVENK